MLSVTDNGEGIPYRQQARIFEPFVHVSRKKGGAGLGLALCKEIVQLHGGQNQRALTHRPRRTVCYLAARMSGLAARPAQP